MAYSLPSSLAPEIGLWAGGQPCLALTISSVASFSNSVLGATRGHLWVGWGCFLSSMTVGSFLDMRGHLFIFFSQKPGHFG